MKISDVCVYYGSVLLLCMAVRVFQRMSPLRHVTWSHVHLWVWCRTAGFIAFFFFSHRDSSLVQTCWFIRDPKERILPDHRRRPSDPLPNCRPVPWTSITSKLDRHFLSLDCWAVCLNGDFQAVYIIKPQRDTPWFYQPLFSSASDHNTLRGSLWEIQMSGPVKINSGSGETWVWLN